MRLPFGFELSRGSTAASEEREGPTISQAATAPELLAFLSGSGVALPSVSAQTAMRVPAVLAAVTFLSRTLATLTLEAFRNTKAGPEKVGGRLMTLVRDAPNPEWSSWAARCYFWQQHLTHGRGLMVILRMNGQPYELWPVNALACSVNMDGFGRKTYTVNTGLTTKTYDAADVIDLPFMLADDQCNHLSPIRMGEKAIQLALAMNDYGATFFAGGGVPPLALEGPMPQGKESLQRAMTDVHRAIEAARASDKPVFPMPSGHKLTQIGYDPAKGQMTDARRLQIEEIGRVWQLPPVFLGDLTKGTFSNTEQQDVFLVKHRVAQAAKAFEDEMNLKLFGQLNTSRAVAHDLDSLQRGDFLSRMEGLAKSVQAAIRTPNEARRSERMPDIADPAADKLFMQGATVPISALGQVQTQEATVKVG